MNGLPHSSPVTSGREIKALKSDVVMIKRCHDCQVSSCSDNGLNCAKLSRILTAAARLGLRSAVSRKLEGLLKSFVLMYHGTMELWLQLQVVT